jgi:hypothetical protein
VCQGKLCILKVYIHDPCWLKHSNRWPAMFHVVHICALRERERQTDRQTDRRTDRQTDRQTDREREKERERERERERARRWMKLKRPGSQSGNLVMNGKGKYRGYRGRVSFSEPGVSLI